MIPDQKDRLDLRATQVRKVTQVLRVTPEPKEIQVLRVTPAKRETLDQKATRETSQIYQQWIPQISMISAYRRKKAMTIQRYSTPDIRILVDPSVVQDIWLTISESDRDELITKTMEDMTVEDNGFTLTLTSEDTAKLPKGIYDTCLIQARVLFVDGSEVNSDIIQKDVGEVLKEGFMV